MAKGFAVRTKIVGALIITVSVVLIAAIGAVAWLGERAVADLDERVTGQGKTLETKLWESGNKLEGQIKALSSDLNARLDKTMSELASGLGVLQGKLNDTATSLGVLQGKLTETATGLQAAKEDLKRVDSRLVVLSEGQVMTNSKVAALEGNLSRMPDRVANLENDLTVTKGKLDKTVADLRLAEQVLVKVVQTLENPPSGAIVIQAVQSRTVADGCWDSTKPNGGTNTYYVEWIVEGQRRVLCYSPASLCAIEVRIGARLPRSCGA